MIKILEMCLAVVGVVVALTVGITKLLEVVHAIRTRRRSYVDAEWREDKK